MHHHFLFRLGTELCTEIKLKTTKKTYKGKFSVTFGTKKSHLGKIIIIKKITEIRNILEANFINLWKLEGLLCPKRFPDKKC